MLDQSRHPVVELSKKIVANSEQKISESEHAFFLSYLYTSLRFYFLSFSHSFDATRPALLLAVLELTCKLATEISVLTAVLSPLIAPFARDILEKGVPKATLWQTFDSWDVSMPSDVCVHFFIFPQRKV